MNSPKPLPVFLDESHLRIGDPLNPKLAQTLCKSMVFILAYQPTYFHDDSVWCTQELVAFLAHEQRRLKEIKKKAPACDLGDYHQLIPVAFSTTPYSAIPQKIAARIYADWSTDFLSLGWEGFVKDRKYRDFIKHVGDRVLNIQMGLETKHGIATLDTLSECSQHGKTLPKPTDPKCKAFIQENWKRPSVI